MLPPITIRRITDNLGNNDIGIFVPILRKARREWSRVEEGRAELSTTVSTLVIRTLGRLLLIVVGIGIGVGVGKRRARNRG